jgi:epoxyqueuosine reductase
VFPLPQPDSSSLDAAEVKRLGRDVGFDLVRIARAQDLMPERERYLAWIDAGRQGKMAWITPDWASRATSPHTIQPGARSVISVGLSYWGGLRPHEPPRHGRIARYTWGADYHTIIGERLQDFVRRLQARAVGEHRWYVDTGPVMDKAFAARSGLGWQGKNTNILTREFGSFVLLGEILTTLELEPDAPISDGCGSCRLCMLACPTKALGPDYSIDSRLCISYLTIEHRGPIPRELRPLMGSWVFGCDICQEVCPPSAAPFLATTAERRVWAAEVRNVLGRGPELRAESEHDRVEISLPDGPLYREALRPSVDLLWLLRLSHQQYLDAFRGTAIRRAKVWMLRRNAAVALGNGGDEGCISALTEALEGDDHPIVRGHAAWALGRLSKRFQADEIRRALMDREQSEPDPEVRDEIRMALL